MTPHGFPRLDDRRGLLLAGCGSDGEVMLLDIYHDGRQLGHFKAGGGEPSLPTPNDRGLLRPRRPRRTVVTLTGTHSG